MIKKKKTVKTTKTASQIYIARVKKARKDADKIWGQIILTLHPRCEYTSCKNKSTDPHHFCPKSISNTLRYDITQGIGLCRGHHFSHHNGNPFIHQDIIEQRGEEWFKYLKQKQQESTKTNLTWYENHIERLSTELIKIQRLDKNTK